MIRVFIPYLMLIRVPNIVCETRRLSIMGSSDWSYMFCAALFPETEMHEMPPSTAFVRRNGSAENVATGGSFVGVGVASVGCSVPMS